MAASITPASNALGAAGRYLAALVTTVVLWLSVCGFATIVFSGQRLAGWYEICGFATGFSIAGVVTSLVVLMICRAWRRTIGFGVASAGLVAAALVILRSIILRRTAPNVGWGQREWNTVTGVIGPSVLIGVSIALVVSILVYSFSLIAQRTARWRFGIVIAVTVTVLGFWVFPLVIWYLNDQTFPYFQWHVGSRYDAARQGALIGAGPGAVTGAIATALITQWLCSLKVLRDPTNTAL